MIGVNFNQIILIVFFLVQVTILLQKSMRSHVCTSTYGHVMVDVGVHGISRAGSVFF